MCWQQIDGPSVSELEEAARRNLSPRQRRSRESDDGRPEALAGDPLARELESDAPAAAAQPPDEPGREAEEKGGCACIVM